MVFVRNTPAGNVEWILTDAPALDRSTGRRRLSAGRRCAIVGRWDREPRTTPSGRYCSAVGWHSPASELHSGRAATGFLLFRWTSDAWTRHVAGTCVGVDAWQSNSGSRSDLRLPVSHRPMRSSLFSILGAIEATCRKRSRRTAGEASPTEVRLSSRISLPCVRATLARSRHESGPEYTEVEKPLLDQLSGLGWQLLEGSKSDPSVTERESFRGSILEARLRAARSRSTLGRTVLLA